MSDAYTEIEALVYRYCDGLYRCDVEQLRELFHDDALYFTASGGDVLSLDMATYLPKVAARTSPESLGEAFGYELELVQFAGPVTAHVRVSSSMWVKRFIDLLTLVKIEDTWKIVAKVFHHEDDPNAKGPATWS